MSIVQSETAGCRCCWSGTPYDKSAPSRSALRRRWFDRRVKGATNGVKAEPAVRVFVMGGGSGRRNAAGRPDLGGRWRAVADWPLPQTQWTKFYLHSDRTLGRETPHDRAQPLGYISDPGNPVPTIGGAL